MHLTKAKGIVKDRVKSQYIYNLGYHSYEESDYYQLYHHKKFSKNEFEQLVAKATLCVIKKHPHKKGQHISFQDVIFEVRDVLIRKFGFQEVEFTATFSVFGWPDILDESDWEHDRDKQLNRLTKALTSGK